MNIFIFSLYHLKQRKRKKICKGIIHIRSTFNNTVITISAIGGKIIRWRSTGICGFQGIRKRTPFASKIITENVIQKRFDQGIKEVRIYIWGPGNGRELAIRTIYEIGIRISIIRDITTLPHNGCRSPKQRWILLGMKNSI